MKYLTRSAKYLLYLCVLSAILIAALYAAGMASGTPVELFRMLMLTSRGWILIGAIVVLSAIYPRIGFMTAYVKGDINIHRRQIVDALETEGLTVVAEENGTITFRAQRFMRRAMFRFDDTITVRQQQDRIAIEGLRKIVARAEYRIEFQIRNDNE